MIIQNVKYILWIFLFFLVFILFNAWKNEKQFINDLDSENKYIKTDNVISNEKLEYSDKSVNNVFINTNLISAEINPINGNFVSLILKKYPNELNDSNGIVIFDKSDQRYYYAQTGILNNNDLDKNLFENFSITNFSYNLKEDDANLFVTLKYELSNNINFYKIYTFRAYSYEINIDFCIQNLGLNDFHFKQYGFIRYKKFNTNNSFFGSGINPYEGGALYTNNKPYKKISFDELNNKNYNEAINGGWTAFLERYFVSAFIPDSLNDYLYIAEKNINDIYSFKYLSLNNIKVLPDECVYLSNLLFVGPKTEIFLSKLHKGLELTIDYGIFWPIANPIFFLLNFIYSFLNNWGFSIILVTLFIKLVFYNLSSMSYRSIGNMKKVQPKLELLKNQYKDDKKEFGNALLNLYKKEKINPFSGCLPILVQVPVFISLYYVLLESIELHHAPFILWINDLSGKDPYYIFPIIMSITMFIQQKMNPPVQDPMQAKVMMLLPIVFLFLFLQFPSGLILYWIVNNLLSILQQWYIVKRFS